MARVLIIAEHVNGKLNPATAKCVACAKSIEGASIDVAVFAASPDDVAAAAAGLDGVSRVVSVANDANEHPLAAVLAPQVAELAADFDYVFGPSTTFGKDLMPRVAALLGVNQLSDVMNVVSPRVFQRPIYAGNAVTTVEVKPDYKIVATVRTASYKAVGEQAAAPIEAASIDGAGAFLAVPVHPRDRAHAVRQRQDGLVVPAGPANGGACRVRRTRTRQRGELQDYLRPRRQDDGRGRRVAGGG